MAKVYLALWWHQHQPFYKDNLTGEYVMPWVRLHGVKDYYGMAALLDECPGAKANFNYVPSLLTQILGYVDGSAADANLLLSRKAAADLNDNDKRVVLQNFFMANAEWMIRPYPRYLALLTKRRPRDPDIAGAVRRFSTQDFLDLQVWANLVWFHPITVEKTPFLQELFKKGRNFTEEEKARLLGVQAEVLAEIIPLHRKLEGRGQIETTTTPFYHPILPLLCNPECARESMPDLPMPKEAEPCEADAREHVVRGIALHQQVFGKRPRGMWPAEGSVSNEAAALMRSEGIQWIGTDEQILERSIRTGISRDGRGQVQNPDVLYRPYELTTPSGPIAMVFRDHNLSDMIGFQYQRSPAEPAADDFVARIASVKTSGRTPPLVSVILDGENAWEYYPNTGVSFLRALYKRLSEAPGVETTTVSDYLAQYPPEQKLPRVFAGSWIDHNFAIWIGHEDDRRAWSKLYKTRQFLVGLQKSGQIAADAAQRAWEEIYIAEGSDWFWWYGDDHHTDQINEFDELFRRHLKNVYTIAGKPAPFHLEEPIAKAASASKYSQPRRFMDVKVDGRLTSFLEWIDAGYCDLKKSGATDQTGERLLRELYFGFSPTDLFLRIDVEGKKEQVVKEGDRLHIAFYSPQPAALVMDGLHEAEQKITIVEGGVADGPPKAAYRHVIEISCPLASLGLSANQSVGFYVEWIRDNAVHERAPRVGGIEFTVPGPDFEDTAW